MPSIKVIFPTERNVHASRNGEMGAGTVCFQQQYWRDPVYPRSVMHDFECVGEMKGSLMHTKVRRNKKSIYLTSIRGAGSAKRSSNFEDLSFFFQNLDDPG